MVRLYAQRENTEPRESFISSYNLNDLSQILCSGTIEVIQAIPFQTILKRSKNVTKIIKLSLASGLFLY